MELSEADARKVMDTVVTKVHARYMERDFYIEQDGKLEMYSVGNAVYDELEGYGAVQSAKIIGAAGRLGIVRRLKRYAPLVLQVDVEGSPELEEKPQRFRYIATAVVIYHAMETQPTKLIDLSPVEFEGIMREISRVRKQPSSRRIQK